MQPLQICIGPIIRIGRESWCLPYAGFFLSCLMESFLHHLSGSTFFLVVKNTHQKAANLMSCLILPVGMVPWWFLGEQYNSIISIYFLFLFVKYFQNLKITDNFLCESNTFKVNSSQI